MPLICYHLVEWCFPDRVVRQFGGTQGVPANCDTSGDLHRIDLRAKYDTNWASYLASSYSEWEHRHDRRIAIPMGGRQSPMITIVGMVISHVDMLAIPVHC